jgi:hypothetical protein
LRSSTTQARSTKITHPLHATPLLDMNNNNHHLLRAWEGYPLGHQWGHKQVNDRLRLLWSNRRQLHHQLTSLVTAGFLQHHPGRTHNAVVGRWSLTASGQAWLQQNPPHAATSPPLPTSTVLCVYLPLHHPSPSSNSPSLSPVPLCPAQPSPSTELLGIPQPLSPAVSLLSSPAASPHPLSFLRDSVIAGHLLLSLSPSPSFTASDNEEEKAALPSPKRPRVEAQTVTEDKNGKENEETTAVVPTSKFSSKYFGAPQRVGLSRPSLRGVRAR